MCLGAGCGVLRQPAAGAPLRARHVVPRGWSAADRRRVRTFFSLGAAAPPPPAPRRRLGSRGEPAVPGVPSRRRRGRVFPARGTVVGVALRGWSAADPRRVRTFFRRRRRGSAAAAARRRLASRGEPTVPGVPSRRRCGRVSPPEAWFCTRFLPLGSGASRRYRIRRCPSAVPPAPPARYAWRAMGV